MVLPTKESCKIEVSDEILCISDQMDRNLSHSQGIALFTCEQAGIL